MFLGFSKFSVLAVANGSNLGRNFNLWKCLVSYSTKPAKINLQYKLITPEKEQEAYKHLTTHFLRDEPLAKALKIAPNSPDFKEYVNYGFSKKSSFMAVTEEKCEVVGVGMNMPICPGDFEKGIKEVEKMKDNSLKKILELIYKENLKKNLFELFKVDKLFEVSVVSVDPNFRGQGIGMKLTEAAIKFAKDEGYKVMKTDATGKFSQQIFEKAGFKVQSETCYNAHVDKCGKPIIKVEEPHTALQLMYKCLE